jgi:hypothetical protein
MMNNQIPATAAGPDTLQSKQTIIDSLVPKKEQDMR